MENDTVSFKGQLIHLCKYGENAWQNPAGLFSCGTGDPLALEKFNVIEGLPPSYNNWCDLDRLLQTMTHIKAAHCKNKIAVAHIALGAKHGNVCGASVRDGHMSTECCLRGMMQGDPLAIFGGLIMVNFPIDIECAKGLTGKMLDGIIAPAFTDEAVLELKRKNGKCRFIVNPALATLDANSLDQAPRFRYVRGGFLRQPNYTFVLNLLDDPEIKRYGPSVSGPQRIDALLAWAIGSTSNSNTITLVRRNNLIGNGVGQQDRVGAAKLAIERALRSQHEIEGTVAYSDSFFPFPDGPQTLIDAGVRVILTSSGSIRDQETIDLCVRSNVSLWMIPDHLGRGFYGH